MKIRLEERRQPDSLRFTHRLWLDNYYQDLTAEDVKELRKALRVRLTKEEK